MHQPRVPQSDLNYAYAVLTTWASLNFYAMHTHSDSAVVTALSLGAAGLIIATRQKAITSTG